MAKKMSRMGGKEGGAGVVTWMLLKILESNSHTIAQSCMLTVNSEDFVQNLHDFRAMEFPPLIC